MYVTQKTFKIGIIDIFKASWKLIINWNQCIFILLPHLIRSIIDGRTLRQGSLEILKISDITALFRLFIETEGDALNLLELNLFYLDLFTWLFYLGLHICPALKIPVNELYGSAQNFLWVINVKLSFKTVGGKLQIVKYINKDSFYWLGKKDL